MLASIVVIIADFSCRADSIPTWHAGFLQSAKAIMSEFATNFAEPHPMIGEISNHAAESTFAEVDDRNRITPAIEFRNVHLSFDDRKVLDNLSFKVMRGETKIILGGSGGGKSTIIKLVLGLLKPDEGRVLVDGEDITTHSEVQMMSVRKKIGMVFQEGALFDSLSSMKTSPTASMNKVWLTSKSSLRCGACCGSLTSKTRSTRCRQNCLAVCDDALVLLAP